MLHRPAIACPCWSASSFAIFSSNLDDSTWCAWPAPRQVETGTAHVTPDGLTPPEQLDAIRARVSGLLAERRRCFVELQKELLPHKVRIVGMKELTQEERRAIDEQFESQIFPVLTPLAVDPGHPFPNVSNLSLSLAVEVRHPEHGTVHFARIKVPSG